MDQNSDPVNANDFGDGAVTTYQPNGKTLVELGANPNGALSMY